MLLWLLSMILGSVVQVETPPTEMVCDGPMITMDPTFDAMYVPEGDVDVIFVNITNNCNRDLSLDLEFSGIDPVDRGTTAFGEIRLIDDPDDLARGGEVDDFGLISLTGLVLRAYETDVRGIVFYANEIEDVDPDLSFHRENVWFDVSVLDDNQQPIFRAETVLEVSVYEVPEGEAGGGGF
jgi:hypothetical protein